jgi:hypothetical protein
MHAPASAAGPAALKRAAHLLPVLRDVVSQPRKRVGELAHSISRQACQQPSQLLAEAAHHQALKAQAGKTTAAARVSFIWMHNHLWCRGKLLAVTHCTCLSNVRCFHPPLIHTVAVFTMTGFANMWQHCSHCSAVQQVRLSDH